MKYNFKEIEKKWQQYWDENKTFRTPEINELDKSKPKYYVLDMFPYPSGAGLHVGHPLGYIASDIVSKSRISPSTTTSTSSRKAARIAVAKAFVSDPTSL